MSELTQDIIRMSNYVQSDLSDWKALHDKAVAQQARIDALEKDYMEEKIEGDRLQARIEALEKAIQAAIDCGMVPKSSLKDGGAVRHSEQVRVADMLRDALEGE